MFKGHTVIFKRFIVLVVNGTKMGESVLIEGGSLELETIKKRLIMPNDIANVENDGIDHLG